MKLVAQVTMYIEISNMKYAWYLKDCHSIHKLEKTYL